MKYIDIHAHIFPHNIAAKAVHALEEYYQAHWEGNGELDDLLSSLEQAHVDRAVIFSSATKPSQVTAINDYIASLVQQYPQKFIGFGTMHPDFPDFEAEIRRIRTLGLRGLKFHPDFQNFAIDDPRMLPVYEAAGEDLVMLFHTGDRNTDRSAPHRLAHVLDEIPGRKIIAAHLGGYSRWEEAKQFLIGRPDVYVDISSTLQWLPEAEARSIAQAHGIDHVLFASDYPAVHHERAIADALRFGFGKEEELEKLFYRNAEKLLGITLP